MPRHLLAAVFLVGLFLSPAQAQEKSACTGRAKLAPSDEQRSHLALLKTMQSLAEQGERPLDNLRHLPIPVSVRGALVKTPDLGSRSPRTGLPQTYHWHLAARTDSGELVLPLQITDKKLLELADTCAGKEVVLSGSTVFVRRLMQRYEAPPFLAVNVASMRLAEK